jgi:hypothetical protein
MNIDQLKTELREFIKLSEKLGSTLWTLEEKDWGWELSAEKYFADLHKLTNEPEEIAEARAAFIASSRNISPTMAKMLLAAVEGLELCANHGQEPERGSARYDLNKILKLWEETK